MKFKYKITSFFILFFLPLLASGQFQGTGIVVKKKPLFFNDSLKHPVPLQEPVTEFPPFCGKKLRSKGNYVPFPFGVGITGGYTDQQFTVSGLKLTSDKSPVVAKADTLYQNTSSSQYQLLVKPDLWLFSFLNLYGIVGYTRGQTIPEIEVPNIIVDIPGLGEFVVDTTFEIRDELNYYGSTYGGGATVSAGYKLFFFILDYNYTITRPNDVYEKITNNQFSPKLGIFLGKNESIWNGSIWIGTMYISNRQNFSGDISVKDISEALIPFFGETATYSGQINSIKKWNFIFGGTLIIGKHHYLFAEAGIIGRTQFMFGYNFRF